MQIKNIKDYESVKKMLREIDFSSAFIHSDIVFGFAFERGLSVKEMLQAHYLALKELLDGKPVWVPTFCYDFTTTGQYDVQNSPSQVGVFTEYFRTHIAKWRSATPVFSFAGDDEPPQMFTGKITDPFDEKSLFHASIEKDAIIIGYGLNTISEAVTIMHYCERVSGKIYYRYDKLFHGTVSDGGQLREVTLKYHVRPKNCYLAYDFLRLESELINAGILKIVSGNRFDFICLRVRDLSNFWTQKLQEDALYLLDSQSRKWIEPELQRLGRPFMLSDFE
ncbi:MAG: AAC(3) family N-acetyltransferase [Tannerella sp.]|jgi:aminoglycoside 3-N-acetyltransferase|nr:AAC(3) family N-acetyltransferase [Tannerella sp.]